jgi:hypothetical protein
MTRLLLALLVASALAGAGVFKLMDTLTARESGAAPAPLKLATQAPESQPGGGSDSLSQVLAGIQARVAFDNSTPVPPPVPDSASSPIGTIRISGESHYPWIFQDDPSGKRPIATVGGEVLLVDVASRQMAKARVLSRYRVVGTGDECGPGELDAALSGWGYSVGRPKLLGDFVVRSTEIVALPSTADARFVPSSVPPSVQAAMHDTLLLAAQSRLKEALKAAKTQPVATDADADSRAIAAIVRSDYESLKQMLFDEQGRLSTSNSLTVFPMRLDGRVLYGGSMSLNDDPSDHGGETRWLMIVDDAGRSRTKVKDVLTVRLIVDVNHDGNDELLTAGALTFFTGTRWQIVQGWYPSCD